MSCLGVHFALTDDDVTALKSLTDEQERLDFLIEELEEKYFDADDGFCAESDKAWDAMHRALADGELTWDGGEYPLRHAVLAGELLYTGEDYIMSLKTPAQVRDVAAALQPIDEAEFRRRYFAINAGSYGFNLSDDDCAYTWEWFQNVRDLYRKAAAAGRHVLFTADQ
jgi:hypothetical protein